MREISPVLPSHRELFAQAVFRGEPFPSDWTSDFAIITAYDPEGVVAPPAANLRADAQLEAELMAAGYRLHRITGGSSDGAHQEPGWAVPIGIVEAVGYGRKYRQLAVFYVNSGRLSLVDCESGVAEDLRRAFVLN
jgi:hypothetical protein